MGNAQASSNKSDSSNAQASSNKSAADAKSSDKGIRNTRSGQVNSTKAAVVLKPGANRLTKEKYEKLKEDRGIQRMFAAKLLEDMAEPPEIEEKPTKAAE